MPLPQCAASRFLGRYVSRQQRERRQTLEWSDPQSSPLLRTALVEAAHAATHTKYCYLSAQYQRLFLRPGGKKATIAVEHTLLVIIYHILAEEKDYQELGGNYFYSWDRQAVQKQLVHRLEKLRY